MKPSDLIEGVTFNGNQVCIDLSKLGLDQRKVELIKNSGTALLWFLLNQASKGYNTLGVRPKNLSLTVRNQQTSAAPTATGVNVSTKQAFTVTFDGEYPTQSFELLGDD